MFKTIYFLIFFLVVTQVLGQPREIQISDGNFSKLLDSFLSESISYFDSMGIENRNLGVVSIEVYDVGMTNFPIGSSFDSKEDSILKIDEHYVLRISMIFNVGFFYGNNPINFSIYKGKPIFFYYGIENLVNRESVPAFIEKKFKSNFTEHNYRVISWVAKIDQSKQDILILSKGLY